MNNNTTINTLFNQEFTFPIIFSKSCSDCLYFLLYDRLCALYYWLLKTRNENYMPPECQGREKFISPKLTACRNFRQKQEKPVEIRLETMLDLSKTPPKRVVVCAICEAPLEKTPTLKTPAKCEICGASYTKTSESCYLLHPTPPLDAIQMDFKSLIGYVPKELEKPKTAKNTKEEGGRLLLLTKDYKITEIDEKSGMITLQTITNTFPKKSSSSKTGNLGLESFHISEIDRIVVLDDEVLTKNQEEKLKKIEKKGSGHKITVKRDKTRKARIMHPSPVFLDGLEKLRGEGQELMMAFSFALHFSVILSTAQAEKYRLIGQETARQTLWRQMEHLINLVKNGKYEPQYFRSCEARIMRELSQELRNTVWGKTGEDERIIAPWIGRTRAKKVKAFEYIPGFTARARTCFDAAANYVNRWLRRVLRLENADAGFGWESKPLFHHKPRDNPGLAAHLDLEEIPKIYLKLQLTKMFVEGKFVPDDFHTGYREFNLPYYTPKPKTMKVLKTSVLRVLKRETIYNGEKFALKEAHVRHVKHLANLILYQKFDVKTYTPQIFVPNLSKNEVFEKLAPLKRLPLHIKFGLRIAEKPVIKQKGENKREKRLQIGRVKKAVQRVLEEANKTFAMNFGGKITC